MSLFRSLSRRFHELPPLQMPSRPERIRHFLIGGPKDPADRRLQLNTATLEHLLEVAKASNVGVAEINLMGLEVSVWERPDGHRYEQVTITGLEPKPKQVPMGIVIEGG